MIFWSPHIAMLIIKQLFASLYMHTISSCLCSITLSVWIGKFHNILHFRALNQEHIYTTCLYHLSGAFCIVANGFLCYFIMSFSVSVLCQIWAGAKNVCDTWSFIGLVNTILHWISSSSLFFQSPFSSLLFSTAPTSYFHYNILFPLQIVNVALLVDFFNWFYFFSFLLTLKMYISKLTSAAVVLTRACLLCVRYFARLHFSS